MTTASTAYCEDSRRPGNLRGGSWWALPCVLLLGSGCVALPWGKHDKPEDSKGPVDSFVFRGDGLERDKVPSTQVEMDLETAKRLFQEKDYVKAQPIFAKLAKNPKVPITVADDALFYEAACQYYRGNYRDAEGTFKKYMKDFRTGAHADESNRHLFEIANYWLDNTRKTMEAYEEKRDGKRTLVWEWPSMLTFHFTRDLPLNDREGHALQCLEEIRFNDIGGPLGEKALFYIATVKFFREEYKDADYYYSQLYEHYPNSPLAPKAVKQAIICKQLCTGGTCYDCRTVEESRKLIDIATKAYPQLAGKEQEWIQRQLVSVNLQQADRDFNIAEFYRRTGHPGSAYFYYELVKRRYPNTEYSEKAIARMNELHSAVVREQGPAATQPRSSAAQAWQRLFGPNVVPAQATAPATAHPQGPVPQTPVQQVSGPAAPPQ